MPLKAPQFFLIIALLLLSGLLHADMVSIKVTDKINARAEYLKGDADKPLLIFIHGFLQTRSFSTVSRLSESLNEGGFPVLSPTLSLGVSDRAKALSCESIHLHSLNSDTDEISKWVDWAVHKGHKNIVLIGHSAGSVNITAYLEQNTHRNVSKSILISLTYYGPGRAAAFESPEHAIRARKMLQNSDQGIEKFALSFCKKYMSTATNFLSYYDWSDRKVLNALNKSFTRNFIIIGSADNRVDKPWLNSLKKSRNEIIIVDGANHFFDQAHEFDLFDNIERILTTN